MDVHGKELIYKVKTDNVSNYINFIDKEVMTRQNLNMQYCKEQLRKLLRTLCKFSMCSISCYAHINMIFNFVLKILQ